MPMMFYTFVGPYLEILYPVGKRGDYSAEREQTEAEGELDELFLSGRLQWLSGRGDPEPVTVRGQLVEQHCGVPSGSLPGMPQRRHFPVSGGYASSGDNVVADLHDVDPETVAAEVAWFKQTFAEELDIVQRVLAGGPAQCSVRWGVVCWVY
jgi:hypothetical protein